VIRDEQGRLLIVKPTYKTGWTIPGGTMELDGETPWQACQREVLEEVGLRVRHGRLVAVDSRPPKGPEPLRVRMLFDCGTLTPEQVAAIRLPRAELRAHRFVTIEDAMPLLRTPIARRVAAGIRTTSCVYLEDGLPATGIID